MNSKSISEFYPLTNGKTLFYYFATDRHMIVKSYTLYDEADKFEKSCKISLSRK